MKSSIRFADIVAITMSVAFVATVVILCVSTPHLFDK